MRNKDLFCAVSFAFVLGGLALSACALARVPPAPTPTSFYFSDMF